LQETPGNANWVDQNVARSFTAEGRMMSVVCDGRAELPSGVRREYSSYCGAYTFDGARLATRVAMDGMRISP
jgi:hypothetical protein